jgi:hypothetical protein
MSKYYVVSGEIRVIISAPHINNHEDAACEAMLQYLQEGVSCAPLIIVSERGFDFHSHGSEEDKVFATNDILIKSGFIFEEEDEF